MSARWQEVLPGEGASHTGGVTAFRSRPEGTEQLPISQEVNYVYQYRESIC
jgi:hypothetical protein